jgi:hypothetical protein
MSNPRIEVDVVANVAGVASGVSAATSQLDKLGNAALATAPKFEQLSKSTSRYNGIGVDFARVIQDAPFGIIGVGNNIQQLAQSFSALGNVGDSGITKLKLAINGIFSSGNLLILGVSALTTALTFLSQKGFFDSEKAAKSLSERLDEYKETLDSVNQATLEGLSNSEKELQRFRELTAQAENLNVSDKNRLAAVNELQKQFPQYLGNLTKEQILTGQVGDSYDALTKQIIANAKAKAFSDEITQNSKDLRTLEKEQLDNANQILAKRIELEKAKAASTESALRVSGQLAATDLTVSNVQSQLNDLIENQISSINESNKIKQANLDLDVLINKELQNGAVFTDKQTKANKELKRSYEEIQKINFDLPAISFDIPDQSFGGVNLDNVQMQINQLDALQSKLQGTGITIEEFYYAIANGAAAGFDNLDTFIGRIADTRVLLQNTFELLRENVTEAFVDLGTSLGEALGSGTNVIKALGNSLLGSVGKLLGDFGKQLIAFGVAGLAYSQLIKSLFTDPITAAPKAGLAIAAGVALVALSGAISAGLKSNSGGGGGGGSSVGSSGAGGGSQFTGLGAQGGMFASQRDLNGELVVRGQDLVYVFGQASNRINKG